MQSPISRRRPDCSTSRPTTSLPLLADHLSVEFTPFDTPDAGPRTVLHAGSRSGENFAEERADPNANVFDAAVKHIAAVRTAKRRVVVAGWTEGSLDRLGQILAEHGLGNVKPVATLADVEKLEPGQAGAAILPLESGFETDRFVVVAEQDILGDRLVRRSKKRKKASDFIAEAAALSAGDIVVHADHGIGRFIGLKTIEAAGAPHDCLEIHYAGDGRLYLPVENIELLSRYGSDSAEAQLDRLGGGAWQSRKAKLKKRLLEMAGQLIRIAAERKMRTAAAFNPPDGLYGEFSARFPYEETDDQQTAIDCVLDDLSAGRPMDRLICGDVGFGKTEVALRAAFVAAMEGLQVAVVVPTTLLARQHFKTFSQRFAGLPVTVRQASRLVGAKELAETKKGIADGTVDIVVGTHALLGSAISFKNLGLLIVDEEQHFGVKHKERLKELKSDVHVLTLSATPIPRTLQLALTGVRELSLIATPPVDRMAVRTFISPFDPLVIRETLLRERYRGGQSFYVVPRISDLAEIHDFLRQSVPELKVATAHGQMPPGELDDIMNAFYDGQYDVLLSTTIVESGLDIPTANTLIVHRADMFGLAQLYQLRGRVGRSKLRAYALFTLPANRKLTDTADRRLKVLQSLDTLGAGFQLASHDLDIRGAGNLLGEEQSGHIKEVGFELYQQMLEEAVAEIRDTGEPVDGGWSPQITVGTAVMIPESYVPDLQLRLALYRRLGDLETTEEIDAFGCRAHRPFRAAARRGPAPSEDRLHQGAVPPGQCRKARCRAEGRRHPFPREEVLRSGRARPLHRRAGFAGEDQARPERRLHARLAERRKAPCRLGRGHDPTRPHGGQGGLRDARRNQPAKAARLDVAGTRCGHLRLRDAPARYADARRHQPRHGLPRARRRHADPVGGGGEGGRTVLRIPQPDDHAEHPFLARCGRLPRRHHDAPRGSRHGRQSGVRLLPRPSVRTRRPSRRGDDDPRRSRCREPRLVEDPQPTFSNSPRALAAAIWRIASASVAASCAPMTAYLPSNRKHGTPVTPMREAVAASLRHSIAVGVAGEQALDHRARPCPASPRGFGQHRMVADISAFLEIELEQPAHELVLCLRAVGARPADDPVRVERVRRHLDGVEGEVDALRCAERLEPGVGVAQPCLVRRTWRAYRPCGPCPQAGS